MEPVDAEKGLSRVGGHEEKTRGGSSTPTPESTTVGPVSPRESQEKEGGGEGTKVTTDDGVEGSIRSIAENDRGQAGQSDSKGVPHDKETMSEVAKDTQAEGTDTDIGGPRAKQKGVRGAEREEERVKGS